MPTESNVTILPWKAPGGEASDRCCCCYHGTTEKPLGDPTPEDFDPFTENSWIDIDKEHWAALYLGGTYSVSIRGNFWTSNQAATSCKDTTTPEEQDGVWYIVQYNSTWDFDQNSFLDIPLDTEVYNINGTFPPNSPQWPDGPTGVYPRGPRYESPGDFKCHTVLTAYETPPFQMQFLNDRTTNRPGNCDPTQDGEADYNSAITINFTRLLGTQNGLPKLSMASLKPKKTVELNPTYKGKAAALYPLLSSYTPDVSDFTNPEFRLLCGNIDNQTLVNEWLLSPSAPAGEKLQMNNGGSAFVKLKVNQGQQSSPWYSQLARFTHMFGTYGSYQRIAQNQSLTCGPIECTGSSGGFIDFEVTFTASAP